MSFVDNVVDQGSGTIRGRAVFPNADGLITPGQFGRIRIPGSPEYDAILIPDAAIVTDQSRKVVLTVDAESVVRPKIIRPGPSQPGGLRIVRRGLEPDDRIIINGLIRARPGREGGAHGRRDRAGAPPSPRQADMRFSHFFVDRPIFAAVISIIVTLIGGLAYYTLAVAQYPEVAPPTVVVSASYPGASAEVVAETVATPLEQQINGVENMLYMVSQSTGDGNVQITITFALGTDLDEAQVLVQNRVSIAEPQLPEEARRRGITTKKNSPDLMMVIHLNSPDGSLDQLYISNYATLQIKDVLARLHGVGDIQVFGARDYSMRVWLNPERMAELDLTATDVVNAVAGQNIQVASGALNQVPVPNPGAFQLSVETLGRLKDVREFENIIVKTDPDGRVTRVRDVARIELGAQDYLRNAYLDDRTATALGIFQLPGSNALATAAEVERTMEELRRGFPKGLDYEIIYNPTEFIQQSVDEVVKTIFEAVALVVVVVILFLQTWRAAIIPIVAIPVSLIGTFAVMAALGFSLNNLSLFGLVLAIGIVVDDAIVVVENVERNLRQGLSPKDAAHRTMDEVGGALLAIALVLCAVFIPAALISGIQGQFYRQFAVTIAASTLISCLVSLTLSPALCALLLKPHEEHPQALR